MVDTSNNFFDSKFARVVQRFCVYQYKHSLLFWTTIALFILSEPVLCTYEPVGIVYLVQILVLIVSLLLYIVQIIGEVSSKWHKIVLVDANFLDKVSFTSRLKGRNESATVMLKCIMFLSSEGEYILEGMMLLLGFGFIFTNPGIAALRCFRVFRLLWLVTCTVVLFYSCSDCNYYAIYHRYYEVSIVRRKLEKTLDPRLGVAFVDRAFRVVKFAMKSLSAIGSEIFKLTENTRGALLLILIFFYSAFVLGAVLFVETEGILDTEYCFSIGSCMFIMMRLSFFDGNGFDFAYSLVENHKILFVLTLVYMCLTAFGILNGLVGIFGTAFARSSIEAFEQPLEDSSDDPTLSQSDMDSVVSKIDDDSDGDDLIDNSNTNCIKEGSTEIDYSEKNTGAQVGVSNENTIEEFDSSTSLFTKQKEKDHVHTKGTGLRSSIGEFFTGRRAIVHPIGQDDVDLDSHANKAQSNNGEVKKNRGLRGSFEALFHNDKNNHNESNSSNPSASASASASATNANGNSFSALNGKKVSSLLLQRKNANSNTNTSVKPIARIKELLTKRRFGELVDSEEIDSPGNGPKKQQFGQVGMFGAPPPSLGRLAKAKSGKGWTAARNNNSDVVANLKLMSAQINFLQHKVDAQKDMIGMLANLAHALIPDLDLEEVLLSHKVNDGLADSSGQVPLSRRSVSNSFILGDNDRQSIAKMELSSRSMSSRSSQSPSSRIMHDNFARAVLGLWTRPSTMHGDRPRAGADEPSNAQNDTHRTRSRSPVEPSPFHVDTQRHSRPGSASSHQSSSATSRHTHSNIHTLGHQSHHSRNSSASTSPRGRSVDDVKHDLIANGIFGAGMRVHHDHNHGHTSPRHHHASPRYHHASPQHHRPPNAHHHIVALQPCISPTLEASKEVESPATHRGFEKKVFSSSDAVESIGQGNAEDKSWEVDDSSIEEIKNLNQFSRDRTRGLSQSERRVGGASVVASASNRPGTTGGSSHNRNSARPNHQDEIEGPHNKDIKQRDLLVANFGIGDDSSVD